MNKQEFSKIIKECSTILNINMDDSNVDKFYQYMQLLLEWNEKINLTAITEPKEIVLKHFIDSITINKYINKNAKVLDIGTGAGFPGIPEKIIREDIDITLADSLNKRIIFLEDVIHKLNLQKVVATHGRAEELAHNKQYRECFDVVTSRAVAPLNVLLEYMLPFTKVNGICICMKGSNVEEELLISDKALKELGGQVIEIESFELPNTDISRNIVIIKKVNNTLNRYPRKAGTPSKDPIV